MKFKVDLKYHAVSVIVKLDEEEIDSSAYLLIIIFSSANTRRIPSKKFSNCYYKSSIKNTSKHLSTKKCYN